MNKYKITYLTYYKILKIKNKNIIKRKKEKNKNKVIYKEIKNKNIINFLKK